MSPIGSFLSRMNCDADDITTEELEGRLAKAIRRIEELENVVGEHHSNLYDLIEALRKDTILAPATLTALEAMRD
jgi:hypothetical protein